MNEKSSHHVTRAVGFLRARARIWTHVGKILIDRRNQLGGLTERGPAAA